MVYNIHKVIKIRSKAPKNRRNIMKLEGAIINFLGDSITEGCGTSCNEKIFSSGDKGKVRS